MGSLLESTSSSGRYKLYRRQYWVCSPGNRDWENSGAHKTYSGLAYLFLLLIKKSLLLLSIRLLPAHPLTWALVPFLEFVYLFAFGIGDGLAIAVCKWLYVSKECLIGKPFSTHAERTAMETVKLKFFFPLLLALSPALRQRHLEARKKKRLYAHDNPVGGSTTWICSTEELFLLGIPAT